ncbi:MAG: bifunctional glutamate N-acetyltransferase/amino-acid acetyltransferase ArgJ [Candidatus Omnitrophica bacterium]|nr:bifunctional glutamate N-acetyltransferase/amino-acid acetyltransferase ArgJ [Candidatus Omnitrophota bacterium]
MKILKNGGVTTPKGFRANGVASGIKRSGKPDLALITSDVPAVAAAVFTKNSIKAAPLLVSQKHLRDHKAQAIVVNSGNANCFTGQPGLAGARRTTEVVGRLLDIPCEDVVVTSTGIIGRPLPFQKIYKAAQGLVEGLSVHGGRKAAEAILTTDTCAKTAAVELALGGKKVTIGACAKGSGMIAPDMATMLAFITTDAAISAGMLKMALRQANDQSFNSITVDGCMSTNDMVVVMANGLAQNKPVVKAGKDLQAFVKALHYVCLDLAKKIVLDGEGATKFIDVRVCGARNERQARKAGLAIANSVLVKTAAFGSNPNWGRVAAAVGALGIARVTEENLKISFSDFARKDITINVDLNMGEAKAVVYTSDLSYEYVKINGEYN